MSGDSIYRQPFIQFNPPRQYGEIHDIIDAQFPDVSPAVHYNMYVIMSNLLVHPKIAVSRSHEHYIIHKALSWEQP
jgi:hypothetical protein